MELRDVAKRVLEIEARAIHGLIPTLDERFDQAVKTILACRGRVIVSGMGKSGLIGQKIAATFSSTGTPAYFMHPAEALHGDLGMLVKGDLLLALSNSGETSELLQLIALTRRLGASIWAITGARNSTLARLADGHLFAGVDREACPLDLVPTASTTATLAMGDALAVACYESNGFSAETFSRFHPGGNLGRKLRTVGEVMHSADELPCVSTKVRFRDGIAEITRGGIGMTCVVDPDNSTRLQGVLTDGDLRRALRDGLPDLETPIAEWMTRSPKTIDSSALLAEALERLERHKITSLPVLENDKLVGVIQIHDLWRTELF
jgi:arabinose-5-phosphate isomerase